MKGFKELGLAMTGVFPVRQAVDMAVATERLGLGSVWFAEDYFFRGGIPYMAAASMATQRVRIGLGVVNPYSRHPALTAMEFATIDEMSNKRAVFGLGSGVPYWMQQMGYAVKKPLSRTKECVELIRQIMTGESITFEGEFFSAKDVKLIFKPVRTHAPIYLAFEGKMGLKMTGEVGDGAILSIFNTPSYVKWAWERVRLGAKEAGRTLEDFEMVSYLPMVIEDDTDKAIGLARDLMKLYLAHSQPGGGLMEHAGITEEDTASFKAADAAGRDVGELVTDKMVVTLGIVGDVESCTKQLQEIVNAGANTVVAFPVPGTDPVKTAETLAKEIGPHLS